MNGALAALRLLSDDRAGLKKTGITAQAERLLQQASWPGNVRELRNLLEYASIITSGDLIQPEHLRLQQQLPP